MGIESSADETAASVVEDGYKLLSNSVASSLDLHKVYGGIVPEIAARSHLEVIIPVVEDALLVAGTNWDGIDAIAVTQGPGLLGSLLIGALTARTLAILKSKPLYAVNHVEAHVFANFLTETPLSGYNLSKNSLQFPFLALTVSGGHTQITLHDGSLSYKLLGQTKDDAVGEAYDKVAKMLGLPYPGGPSVDQASRTGNANAIVLPRPQMANPYDFSFSGLKTAVLRASQALAGKDYTLPSEQLPTLLNKAQKADIAASFQAAAVSYLLDTLEAAAKQYKPASVALAGGVAANTNLRNELSSRLNIPVFYPDIKLCTDNAAMIATLAYAKAQDKKPQADPYNMEVIPTT